MSFFAPAPDPEPPVPNREFRGLFERLAEHGITVTNWKYYSSFFGCWKFDAESNMTKFRIFWDAGDRFLHIDPVVNGRCEMTFIEWLTGPREEVIAATERILLERFSNSVSEN